MVIKFKLNRRIALKKAQNPYNCSQDFLDDDSLADAVLNDNRQQAAKFRDNVVKIREKKGKVKIHH